jgi:hypothetical protein
MQNAIKFSNVTFIAYKSVRFQFYLFFQTMEKNLETSFLPRAAIKRKNVNVVMINDLFGKGFSRQTDHFKYYDNLHIDKTFSKISGIVKLLASFVRSVECRMTESETHSLNLTKL